MRRVGRHVGGQGGYYRKTLPSDRRTAIRRIQSIPTRRGWKTRFYGGFIYRGKPRRYGLQVIVGERLSPHATSRLIAYVQTRINVGNEIPLHEPNETVPSFHDLINRPWVRVQRITMSEVDVNS